MGNCCGIYLVGSEYHITLEPNSILVASTNTILVASTNIMNDNWKDESLMGITMPPNNSCRKQLPSFLGTLCTSNILNWPVKGKWPSTTYILDYMVKGHLNCDHFVYLAILPLSKKKFKNILLYEHFSSYLYDGVLLFQSFLFFVFSNLLFNISRGIFSMKIHSPTSMSLETAHCYATGLSP